MTIENITSRTTFELNLAYAESGVGIRFRIGLPFFLILVSLTLLAVQSGCNRNSKDNKSNGTAGDEVDADPYFLTRTVSPESCKLIEAFCGDCHAMPRASSFPIDVWRKEVEQGFDFYDQAARTDLKRPNLYDTIAYFTQKAPPRESFFTEVNNLGCRILQPDIFETINMSRPRPAGVSDLLLTEIDIAVDGNAPQKITGILSCDMEDGTVKFEACTAIGARDRRTLIYTGRSPVNATECDLNQDGKNDYLISDIGQYEATDSKKGQIVLLENRNGAFESKVLYDNAGRVCQTVVADFDGDNREDILVAEFGYFLSGSIFMLRRTGEGSDATDFEKIELDNRHGTVKILVHDFDQDGDLDFAACIAQEYEVIDLFLNDGKGKFEKQNIFDAGFPSYGSSGMELVDLDQDGDVDILYTNGDTFDSSLPKKYHSVQWLENVGGLKFEHHHIQAFPGVHSAKTADFDKDGDLDIVACAFMQHQKEAIDYDSIIYLENLGDQKFKRYFIEKNQSLYPSLEIGDFNEDGKTDFAVGTVLRAMPSVTQLHLQVYRQLDEEDNQIQR